MNKQVKILIADDHQMVAGGVKAILESREDYKVLEIVHNGKEVIDFVGDNKVDIVLMDINMPVMNGLECTKILKEMFSKIRVIILTMYNRKQFLRELIAVGADGCLLKSNSGTELITAIDRVISGKTYFDEVNDFIDAPKTMLSTNWANVK